MLQSVLECFWMNQFYMRATVCCDPSLVQAWTQTVKQCVYLSHVDMACYIKQMADIQTFTP